MSIYYASGDLEYLLAENQRLRDRIDSCYEDQNGELIRDDR